MPAHAGIHVFFVRPTRRGYRACARHDAYGQTCAYATHPRASTAQAPGLCTHKSAIFAASPGRSAAFQGTIIMAKPATQGQTSDWDRDAALTTARILLEIKARSEE